MQASIHVKTLQFNIKWEDIGQNLNFIDNQISSLKDKTDLLILPEMFTTGFTMFPAPIAESMEDRTLKKMKSWAEQLEGAVCGSIVIKEEENYFNRFVFVNAEGDVEIYDKRHLFGLAGEGKHYSGGKSRPTFEYKGWRICPQICYDLRFPVWSRNTSDYDLLIYVASWPETRHSAWEKLLQARAIENQAYVIGVNRCGLDGNDYAYKGGSMIIDYMGDPIQVAGKKDEILSVELTMSDKEAYREKFPFLEDRDSFAILEQG
jgi:omega-amidase